MSINELAVVVNDNFTVPLNKQMRDNRFLPARIIETTQDFVVERSGWYKIICVGAGGDSTVGSGSGTSGGAGGVSISTKLLTKGDIVPVSISDGTTSIQFFGMTAEKGGDATSEEAGSGGNAYGGEENYKGLDGKRASESPNNNGAGVGVYIPELSFRNLTQTVAWSESSSYSAGYATLIIAPSLLGYGHSSTQYYKPSGGSPRQESYSGAAACIIIPLEYTE